MKFFLLYLILIFLNNCSFDDKSGIWKMIATFIKIKKIVLVNLKVSTSIDPFNEIIQIKKDYKFKLSKKITPKSWKQIYFNQNNNLNNFEYNNSNELFSKAKRFQNTKLVNIYFTRMEIL